MSTAQNTEAYAALTKSIEQSFLRYQSTRGQPLPNVGLLLTQYTDQIDLDYLLKLLVQGCQKLLAAENISAQNLEKDLREWQLTIRAIAKLEHSSGRFVRFHAWLDFRVVRLCQFKDGLKDYVKAFRWLRYCYDINDPDTAHFLLFCDLSRDEEMRLILFGEDGSVRDFFRDPKYSRRIYLDKLSSRFLARYDLDASFLLLEAFENANSRHKLCDLGKEGLRRLLLKSPACWFSIVTTLFLVLATQGYFYRGIWKRYAEYVGTWEFWSSTINSSKVQTWVLLPYQFASLILLSVVVIFAWRLRRRGFRQFRRLLPRLFGGILLGYIPLMSSEDIWKWLLTVKPVQALLIWLLAAGLSYVYLLVEARNSVSDSAITKDVKRDLIIRCTQVYLIGWAEAYLIGIVLCELLGGTVMGGLFPGSDPLLNGPLYVIRGLMGTLVPRVVLLYAPLALSLGILVQLIWEEKTATQPL